MLFVYIPEGIILLYVLKALVYDAVLDVASIEVYVSLLLFLPIQDGP